MAKDNKCQGHTDVSKGVRYSTGENILGKIVSGWVEDMECTKCHSETLRVLTDKELKERKIL